MSRNKAVKAGEECAGNSNELSLGGEAGQEKKNEAVNEWLELQSNQQWHAVNPTLLSWVRMHVMLGNYQLARQALSNVEVSEDYQALVTAIMLNIDFMELFDEVVIDDEALQTLLEKSNKLFKHHLGYISQHTVTGRI